MRAASGLGALGLASLLLAATVFVGDPRRDIGSPTPHPDIPFNTVLGHVGDDPISIRDLEPSEQQGLQRLRALIDEAKRETLMRLEGEALLLGVDPSGLEPPESPVGDPEIDVFLGSVPPIPAAAGDPRDLARHVLSLRARREARSLRIDALRAEILIERFLPSSEEGRETSWPTVLARVGTRVVTDADVEQEGRIRLFQLRSQYVAHARRAFATRADEFLLEKEAAARGTTVQALTAARPSAATAPSDAEVDSELRRRGLSLDGPPERRTRARELLAFRARDAHRSDLMARLRAERPVAFALAYPTPPRVEVAGIRSGPGDPPITLLVFTNLRCRICAATNEALEAVEAGPYAGSVRVLHRPFFPEAALPLLMDALAEVCATEQGVGAAFRQRVIAAVAGGGLVDAAPLALDTALDPDRMERCLADPRIRETVEAQRAEAERIGFTDAPAFLLNGLPLLGFQGQARLQEIIAAEIGASTHPDALAATTQRRPR